VSLCGSHLSAVPDQNVYGVDKTTTIRMITTLLKPANR
jgi:ABC-type Na+ transport system ATPase subunit NatA